ncbi:MAG: pyridoxine 5'-phosphate synthase [Bdellovibrionales bacterium]|nr:pyridoxine 5'-phosphate synthase [Bdellovibrionales bacterium]
MTQLSVNVNKLATLRNARGGNNPNVLKACQDIVRYGARGITVHPRPDERHITRADVYQISAWLKEHNSTLPSEETIEFNVEGFPSDEFLVMMKEIRPDQCTLVPDPPDVLTSNAGWHPLEREEFLKPIVQNLKDWGIRSSLFINPYDVFDGELAALERVSPDRIELYTQMYAENFKSEKKDATTEVYRKIAVQVFESGMEINAGHDLDLDNLGYLVKKLPMLKEVSIGHALICEALYLGLERTVKSYLRVLSE